MGLLHETIFRDVIDEDGNWAPKYDSRPVTSRAMINELRVHTATLEFLHLNFCDNEWLIKEEWW